MLLIYLISILVMSIGLKMNIYFLGGKGINVACVLKELGFESTCLGFTAGFTGQELQRGLKDELKLMSQMIQVNQGMTRINMKIHSQQETEINGNGF